MPTASEPYTPEELAALEAQVSMRDASHSPCSRETCLRLIHQLRQQTARAEAAETGFQTASADYEALMYQYSACHDEKAQLEAEREAARTALAEKEGEAQAATDTCEDLGKALAAAEVERARLHAALVAIGECNGHSEAALQRAIAAIPNVLTASPHADLVAVRTVRDILSRIIAMGDTPGLMRNAARNALAALPSWCREQP